MIDCDGCSYEIRAKVLTGFQWREFKGEIPVGYDWVLVCDKKGNLPYIAEFSKANKAWHIQNTEYTTLDEWYDVRYWKPIYDEAVPCCGLSEADWHRYTGFKKG